MQSANSQFIDACRYEENEHIFQQVLDDFNRRFRGDEKTSTRTLYNGFLAAYVDEKRR